MKKILIIDGQGGKIGASLLDALRVRYPSGGSVELVAVGTNSSATENMLRRSPDAAATGENPVIVNSRDADVIAGPVGIAIADSLWGEVTPKMAMAVGQSQALRVLIPVNRCRSVVVGADGAPLAPLIQKAVQIIAEAIDKD